MIIVVFYAVKSTILITGWPQILMVRQFVINAGKMYKRKEIITLLNIEKNKHNRGRLHGRGTPLASSASV